MNKEVQKTIDRKNKTLRNGKLLKMWVNGYCIGKPEKKQKQIILSGGE